MIPVKERYKIKRKDPQKRAADERVKDFKEIQAIFSDEEVVEQANRCILCKHEPCVTACPVHNHIPQWIELVADGKVMEAAKLSHQTSNLPEVCGRICPQDRLCEKDCVIGIKGKPVAIGAIETYINEKAFAEGFEPEFDFAQAVHSQQRVAVVGSGPAGLAAAEQLARKGYPVTVFDRYPHPGGLLIYGIPGFKLEKSVVLRRIDWLTERGVEFVCNTSIGNGDSNDHSIDDLLNEGYKAIFLGHGATKPKVSGLAGDDMPNVLEAIPFLIRNNLSAPFINSDDMPPIDLGGQRVAVLGGGDTAMDCVRTAARSGAASVTCFYRRDEENMPGSRREVRSAREEGVNFEFLAQPLAFLGTSEAQLTGIEFQRMELSEADESGRQACRPSADAPFTVEADIAIVAFGFDPDGVDQSQRDQKGRYVVDETFMTSTPGVFAGGDNVRGADLVVSAIADGRNAAQAMDGYLTGLRSEQTQPMPAAGS